MSFINDTATKYVKILASLILNNKEAENVLLLLFSDVKLLSSVMLNTQDIKTTILFHEKGSEIQNYKCLVH